MIDGIVGFVAERLGEDARERTKLTYMTRRTAPCARSDPHTNIFSMKHFKGLQDFDQRHVRAGSGFTFKRLRRRVDDRLADPRHPGLPGGLQSGDKIL